MLSDTSDRGILEEDQHKCFVKIGPSGFINGLTGFKVCLTTLTSQISVQPLITIQDQSFCQIK